MWTFGHPGLKTTVVPLEWDDTQFGWMLIPEIYVQISTFPWIKYDYDELKRYIRIEYALRMRTVDDQGVYTGYTHEYISPTRQCNGEDFGDIFESSPENYICPDINEEDVKNFYL